MIAGGQGVGAAARDQTLLAEIRRLAAGATHLCSVCTGAWLLAAAGLLAGRRVTTHWEFAATLQRHHPDLRVDPDPIFINDGPIWTSAGVTAGIDLALALVEADIGRAAALYVARRLVVFLRRPGGQAQFSAPLALQTASPGFDDLHAWILCNLAADLRVEALAARAGMSPRTFARRYAAATGQTPARAVTRLRLEAARGALAAGAALKSAAAAHGFADAEHFRRLFVDAYGLSPAAYAATLHTKNEILHV
jgi:transcriptional regulator GlxA family with amidase domain